MCRNFQNLNIRSLRILLYAVSMFIVVVVVALLSSPFSNILNAGIIVADKATLYINSTDTTWLKINADGDAANGIDVYGNLRIDSVKITSWNPETNDYAKADVDGTIPRPYIMVEGEATGTTDITNSELAYLGYEGDYKTPGLRYNGGDGSILKGNHIHHLKTGFYSDGVGGIIIEGNHVHDNAVYGLDPHTGTHDMIIRNNVVHNNGEEGIICSLDCYNITIEGNEIYNNTIINTTSNGILVNTGASDNTFTSNTIINATEFGINVDEDSADNIF